LNSEVGCSRKYSCAELFGKLNFGVDVLLKPLFSIDNVLHASFEVLKERTTGFSDLRNTSLFLA